MAGTNFLRVIAQAAALVAVGAGVGLTANALGEGGLPLDRPVLAPAEQAAACAIPEPAEGVVDELRVDQAQTLHALGVPFVDARDSVDYAIGHVTGALHLPQRGECPDAAAVMLRLGTAEEVVVYGDGLTGDGRQLAHALAAEGHGRVHILQGGFDAWRGAAQSGMCTACGVQADVPAAASAHPPRDDAAHGPAVRTSAGSGEAL